MKTQYTLGDSNDVNEFLIIMSNMAIDFREGNEPCIEQRATGTFFFMHIYGHAITFIAEVTTPSLVDAMKEKIAWNKAMLFSQVPAYEQASVDLRRARDAYIEKETTLIRQSTSSHEEYLKVKLSRSLLDEAIEATPDEYQNYANAYNKVFLGACGVHPNSYFEKLGVSVRF